MGSNCDYTKAVFDHFQNPRNMGEIEDADGVGTVGNPSCGDVLKVMLKVDGDKISDVKFQTFGCAAAIASSSMMTTLVKGKKISEAKKITNKDVAAALGQLPPIKVHCSNLAADALQKAIGDLK
ncbi:Fe-S cluster assembly scaffold protein NifU [archaeon]|mgnify:CR=1 FL=1|jgi:nitrogen fixation protein NifU and related proteins|nr:Fe-S cluster assembly scaffold protein NifU [archaeon]